MSGIRPLEESTKILRSERLVVTMGPRYSGVSGFSRFTPLYEQMQLCSVEAGFPQEDLLDFAARTDFFGFIYLKSEEIEPVPTSLPDHHPSSIWPANYLSRDELDSHIPLGLIYLVSTQVPPYPPGSRGELSVGIILAARHRGKGYARETLELVLDEAFQNMACHRVQATVLDNSAKERTMRLFMNLHFVHEGRRRRSFYSMIEQEWKDTTCLAILDTDWMLARSKLIQDRDAPTSLWDELLTRHENERAELLRWEKDQENFWGPRGLKRTSSMETVRLNMNYITDASDEIETSSSEAEDRRRDVDHTESGSEGQSDFEFLGLPPISQASGSSFPLARSLKGKGKRSMEANDAHDSSESESEVAEAVKLNRRNRSLKARKVERSPSPISDLHKKEQFKLDDAEFLHPPSGSSGSVSPLYDTMHQLSGSPRISRSPSIASAPRTTASPSPPSTPSIKSEPDMDDVVPFNIWDMRSHSRSSSVSVSVASEGSSGSWDLMSENEFQHMLLLPSEGVEEPPLDEEDNWDRSRFGRAF